MKKIAIIISIYSLFIFSLNAQHIDKIKKNKNVFFILFDHKDEYMKRIDNSTNNDRGETFRYDFYFYSKAENKKKQYNFSFGYWKYWTFDDAIEKINERMIFKLNKSFLRKNKDIIITREFMGRIGEKAITELLAGSFNHIFLIDRSEINNNKILVREVRFNFSEEI